ncbi:hypothetical protein THAOC_19612 [Thalassiosira oceanica]|uniref:Uncharacterized protein n=1 Tax=Thalassiosira oceanica TaxID=159749 RepID=K0S216_THAOC|nr:hypothetical protein THAOC_19612 [Thalassiosira oceanica]|eukprot:EJK60103.1 hypothetical protein THAOC_19612 [Thalassiosira oceanica]
MMRQVKTKTTSSLARLSLGPHHLISARDLGLSAAYVGRGRAAAPAPERVKSFGISGISGTQQLWVSPRGGTAGVGYVPHLTRAKLVNFDRPKQVEIVDPVHAPSIAEEPTTIWQSGDVRGVNWVHDLTFRVRILGNFSVVRFEPSNDQTSDEKWRKSDLQ